MRYKNHIDLKRALDDGMIPDTLDLSICHDPRRIKLLFRKNELLVHSYMNRYFPRETKLKLLMYYGAETDHTVTYCNTVNHNLLLSYYPEY
jgi:hypothetical protein